MNKFQELKGNQLHPKKILWLSSVAVEWKPVGIVLVPVETEGESFSLLPYMNEC